MSSWAARGSPINLQKLGPETAGRRPKRPNSGGWVLSLFWHPFSLSLCHSFLFTSMLAFGWGVRGSGSALAAAVSSGYGEARRGCCSRLSTSRLQPPCSQPPSQLSPARRFGWQAPSPPRPSPPSGDISVFENALPGPARGSPFILQELGPERPAAGPRKLFRGGSFAGTFHHSFSHASLLDFFFGGGGCSRFARGSGVHASRAAP